MGSHDLTKAQVRMLVEVRAAGQQGRVYNGRASRTIERLKALKLVSAEYDLQAQVKGGGCDLGERITVHALPTCPGSGQRAATNWRVLVCPVCHRSEAAGLGGRLNRDVRALPTVPQHAPREW